MICPTFTYSMSPCLPPDLRFITAIAFVISDFCPRLFIFCTRHIQELACVFRSRTECFAFHSILTRSAYHIFQYFGHCQFDDGQISNAFLILLLSNANVVRCSERAVKPWIERSTSYILGIFRRKNAFLRQLPDSMLTMIIIIMLNSSMPMSIRMQKYFEFFTIQLTYLFWRIGRYHMVLCGCEALPVTYAHIFCRLCVSLWCVLVC